MQDLVATLDPLPADDGAPTKRFVDPDGLPKMRARLSAREAEGDEREPVVRAVMSFRQGFFVVRDLPESALPEALLAAASHAPADAAYERFVLERCGPWSAALILDQYGFAHRWAQAVSFERRVTAVSFFILEGTWSYAIFDSGAHVLGMQFFPHPRPLLEGNANKAAALLGCPADIFGRYHAAILAACDAPEATGYPRAYEDDEYEAADEYGFMDFAQRAGIPGDPPFGTEPIGIHADTPRPPTWVGLPPMPHIYAGD